MTKHFVFITFLLLVMGNVTMVQTNQSSQKITINDLKPDINFSKADPVYVPLQQKAGWALLSSAILPGSGQVANNKWLRAGLYFLAEAIMVGIHIKSYHDANVEQRRYKRFADNNWSVVTYSQWLVEYHEENNLTNSYIDDLREQIKGKSANYNPDSDWNKVDIELLRNVEERTLFVYPNQIGNNFSHVMPDYGFQQYYELISKYFQYGPGWNDFSTEYQLLWDGTGMPQNFVLGANMAEGFNDSYRLAGNMVSFLILNHIVSAFDAFLTVKSRNKKLETKSNLMNPHRTFSVKIHF